MEILADTNAWYAGLMCFSSVREDGRPVLVRRRNGGAVAAAIKAAIASNSLVISDAVGEEVIDGMENAFMSAAKSAHARPEAGAEAALAALARFEQLRGIFGIPDDPGCVADVASMYADISRDPRMAGAVCMWRSVKERHRKGESFPAPETHWNDFVIISTAAGRAARGIATSLLTCDHDILAFADIIRERFGVVAVDCHPCADDSGGGRLACGKGGIRRRRCARLGRSDARACGPFRSGCRAARSPPPPRILARASERPQRGRRAGAPPGCAIRGGGG